MTQLDQILGALKERPLTSLEAFKFFNCTRLAARVGELRATGHDIHTERVTIGKKSFARYHLINREPHTLPARLDA